MKFSLLILSVCALDAASIKGLPEGKPAASVDLMTADGLTQTKAEWRACQPKASETDLSRAGRADFDDSRCEVLTPESLRQERNGSRHWYRLKITIPERVGKLDTTGTTAVFETGIGDYAEIWVDGELTHYAGQAGGSRVAGFQALHRVVIGRNVKPGQQIQLAVFRGGGPISMASRSTAGVRSATMEIYAEPPGPVAISPAELEEEVERIQNSFTAIVGSAPNFVKLAEGFGFMDGPVWFHEGYLLFSDYSAQKIYRYDVKTGSLSVFRENSPSKGMAVDPEGRLTICETGNRRVIRLEKDRTVTVLADKYEGKRLNSPDDLVYRSDGTLYFTDRPYGRPELLQGPLKELPFSGVYALQKGVLRLLDRTTPGAQGIALSPDEKYLYVTNHSGTEKTVLRYDVEADGSVRNRKVFFDMSNDPGKDALSSMKADARGNLYVTGPRGIWVLSPAGEHIGTILTGKHPRNIGWADSDNSGSYNVYMCTPSALYRMKLSVPGPKGYERQ